MRQTLADARASSRRTGRLRRLLAGALIATAVVTVSGPTATQAMVETGPFTIDLSNRENVRQSWYNTHQAANDVPMGWTGSIAGCNAGTVSADYLAAVQSRTNWFRAMAGVPSNVEFTADNNAKAQQAALMMSANKQLSHGPPNTWACYTEAGREGAAKSNLTLGNHGVVGIDALMYDGSDLGHRRNMLEPRMAQMGAGAVPDSGENRASLAQWVLSPAVAERPPVRDEFVAWPPKGFVPYQVAYPQWSFSLAGADFSAATVTMQTGGAAVAIKARANATFSEPALIWQVDAVPQGQNWPRPENDTTYSIAVSNVMVGGVARNFAYDVTIFDPALGDPARTVPVVSGADTAPVGQDTTYTVTAIPNATGYQWRTEQLNDVTIVDSAATAFTNFDAQNTDYQVIDAEVFASAPSGFRLTMSNGFGVQALTAKQTLLINANSQLTFKSRLESADNLAARVQVSADAGATWTNVDEQIKTGREGVFSDRVVPLGALAGQKVQLRFSLETLGTGGVFTCCGAVGWYFDDISITNVTAVGAPVLSEVSAEPSFVFRPAAAANYDVSVRPNFPGSGFGAWSAAKRVSSQAQAVAPTITTQPAPQTAVAGADVTFAAAADGTPTIRWSWTFNGAPLVDGPGVQGATTSVLRLTGVTAARAGSYAARAENDTGAATSNAAALTITAPAGLAAAVDTDGLALVSTGDAAWTNQAAITNDGVDAAQSGRITDGQSSHLDATVTGPATLSFMWKVDSEQNFDYLNVLVDGVVQDRISGAVDWVRKDVMIPAGQHQVRWSYVKDGSVSNGQDAGWIDQVVVQQAAPAPTLNVAVDSDVALATAGDAVWMAQTATTNDGVDAVQSGDVADNQVSSLTATVNGPATVTFSWKVDSEQNFDFLTVALDGAVQQQISGSVDWAQQAVAVPAGQHEVRWSYVKDGSVTNGRDAGWVDQVVVTATP